ncbi:MAG: glycosyltransferase family 2 protein [Oscillochloris sp.]|nr:glycosyltransferase family 2 protein [Oscillochloris sp.]
MNPEDTLAAKLTSFTSPQQSPIVALIPAYNEERFIGSLVLAVRSYVDIVVVIDDGSQDQTEAIAQRAGAIVVRHVVNQGKAAAVNTGFTYVRSLRPFALIMLDGDGQHCANDIPQVLAPVIEGDADVVLGTRFHEAKSDIPAYRQVGQHGLTIATNLTSGVWVSDSQSGFRAFSQRAVEYLRFSQGGFSIESEMQFLIRDHSLRLVEVPIKVIYAEPAKRNPVTHGIQVVNGILQLVGQIRPLLFFSMSGLLVFLGGGVLGIYIIDIYSRTHELAIGYGLITVVLCVIGVLLLFAGMILHSTRGMLLNLHLNLMNLIVGTYQRFESDSDAITVVMPTTEAPAEELALELGKGR